MDKPTYITLDDRGVIRLAGDGVVDFLQGLVSNDVSRAEPGTAVYAALLTPQGKYLHDFFVFADGDALWLDCEADRRDDLTKRLKLYRLRAKIDIDDLTDTHTAIALPNGVPAAVDGWLTAPDPRNPAMGARAIAARDTLARIVADAGLIDGDRPAYTAYRIALGIPDGSRDLAVDGAYLLENGFEALNGVDFDKGCYVGQEVTARMKHRAKIRKRLVPVDIDGATPEPGTPVMLDDTVAGEMKSAVDGAGLALLRQEAIDAGKTMDASGTKITVAASAT